MRIDRAIRPSMVQNKGKPIITQIFGDFTEPASSSRGFLTIGFSPSSLPLKHCWRNNGLSAKFIADYLIASSVDSSESSPLEPLNAVHSAVRYIANELLENATKFNDAVSQQPVQLKLEVLSDRLSFYASNAIALQKVPLFQAVIHELLTYDPAELLIRRLEQNVQENWSRSGLGLITIMNDYQAKLGWKFEPIQNAPYESATVTVTVQLPL